MSVNFNSGEFQPLNHAYKQLGYKPEEIVQKLTVLDKKLKLSPDHEATLLAKAYCLMHRIPTASRGNVRNFSAALTILKQLEKRNPNDWLIYELKGIIYQHGGDGIEKNSRIAMNCFRKALKLQPKGVESAATCENIAVMYHRGEGVAKNNQIAKMFLLKVLQAKPGDDTSTKLLKKVDIELASAKPEKPIMKATATLVTFQDSVEVIKIANRDHREYKEQKALERVVEQQEELLCHKREEEEAALKRKQEAELTSKSLEDQLLDDLKKKPEDAQVISKLADLYRKTERAEKSEPLFVKASKIDPKDSFTKSRFAELLRKGNKVTPIHEERAYSMLTEICEKEPEDLFAKISLAAMLAQGGKSFKRDKVRAICLIREVLNKDSNHLGALRLSYLICNRSDEMLQRIKSISKKEEKLTTLRDFVNE